MSDFTRFEPPTTPGSQPFWDATRDQRLLYQWCRTCERPFFYPREVCPRCLGTEFEWRESAGNGAIYALTIEHRPSDRTAPHAPRYAVVLAEFDEGFRIMANIEEPGFADARVGDRVTIAWRPLSDGRHLPNVTLAR